jgi:hypothetical protein
MDVASKRNSRICKCKRLNLGNMVYKYTNSHEDAAPKEKLQPGKSTERSPVFNFLIGDRKNYGTILPVKARHKTFGDHGANLFWRKIQDTDHLLPQQIFLGIMVRDLSAGLSLTYPGTEIDYKYQGRFSGFGKIPNLQHRARHDFQFFKI